MGALVVVFDYVMKFSGFKIPFTWLPFLNFDFTGIPIFLSYTIFGLPSAIVTSFVAFFAILVHNPKLSDLYLVLLFVYFLLAYLMMKDNSVGKSV